MSEITCTIDIDAPAEVIWRVLVDFAHYREWNPFIRSAHGRAKMGARVRVRVRPLIPVPLPLIFHAKVTAVEHARELRWLGHVLAPWLGSGDHTFILEPLGPEKTRLTQHEVFTGALPLLLHRLLDRETGRGFDAMNGALKKRAESRLESAPVAPERADFAMA